MTGPGLSRRRALGGITAAGIGVPLLAACGEDGDSATDPSTTTSSSSTPGSGGQGGGQAVATTSEVPVGSGVVIADAEVVITQPTEGEFKGFGTACTHQGCAVNEVTDTINCPCHGSQFSIEDGAPLGGPAPSPLSEVPLKVQGDQITLA